MHKICEMKAIKEKSINEIKNEWDNISHLRHRQITNGTDLSYKYVILPCVLELSKNSNFSSILDVGCGTGILEAELASLSKKIVGVDLSSKNIEIAKLVQKTLMLERFRIYISSDPLGVQLGGALKNIIAISL